jgi:hypothetical protein
MVREDGDPAQVRTVQLSGGVFDAYGKIFAWRHIQKNILKEICFENMREDMPVKIHVEIR